jgi:hypothetical protein
MPWLRGGKYICKERPYNTLVNWPSNNNICERPFFLQYITLDAIYWQKCYNDWLTSRSLWLWWFKYKYSGPIWLEHGVERVRDSNILLILTNSFINTIFSILHTSNELILNIWNVFRVHLELKTWGAKLECAIQRNKNCFHQVKNG